MTLLAFDTATAACVAALRREDGEIFEHRPDAGRIFAGPAHATELLPAIVELLDRADRRWSDLRGVVVGVGPGAFTGLRIGVATARAIATARSLPLTPVSSLAALALTAADGADAPRLSAVLPVIDARRGEFYHRLPDGLATTTDSATTATPDAVCGPEELVERAAGVAAAASAGGREGIALAVGDGAIKLRDALTAVGFVVPDEGDPRHVVSAAALLSLAGEPARSPEDVTPNYIRPPDAKVSAREDWLVTAAR